jgi:uncharacterized membrane protein YeaQ/YmgE (transglycosylase-associated protein family)
MRFSCFPLLVVLAALQLPHRILAQRGFRQRRQLAPRGDPGEFFEAVGANATETADTGDAANSTTSNSNQVVTGAVANSAKNKNSGKGSPGHPAAPLIGDTVGQFLETALGSPEVGDFVGDVVTDILNTDVGQAVLTIVAGDALSTVSDVPSMVPSDAPSTVPSDAPSASPVAKMPPMKQKNRQLQNHHRNLQAPGPATATGKDSVGPPKTGMTLGDQIGELVGEALGNPDVGAYVADTTGAFFNSDVGQAVLKSPEIGQLLGDAEATA